MSFGCWLMSCCVVFLLSCAAVESIDPQQAETGKAGRQRLESAETAAANRLSTASSYEVTCRQKLQATMGGDPKHFHTGVALLEKHEAFSQSAQTLLKILVEAANKGQSTAYHFKESSNSATKELTPQEIATILGNKWSIDSDTLANFSLWPFWLQKTWNEARPDEIVVATDLRVRAMKDGAALADDPKLRSDKEPHINNSSYLSVVTTFGQRGSLF